MIDSGHVQPGLQPRRTHSQQDAGSIVDAESPLHSPTHLPN